MRTILYCMLFLLVYTTKASASSKIMFSNAYPPFSYINEKGELTGFHVDIAKAILNLYNEDFSIEGGNWYSINDSLNLGTIQAIGGAHYPQNADKSYLYSRATINSSHCLLYNKNHIDKISLEILQTIPSPVVVLWKNEMLEHYILSINPSTKMHFVKNYKELVHALEREDITCAIAKRIASMYFVDQAEKNHIIASKDRVLEQHMGFKISTDAPELANILNNGMDIIISNGTYEDIYEKWINKYNTDHSELQHYLRIIIISGISLLFTILFLLLINRILTNKIRIKTKKLQEQLILNSQIMKELEKEKKKAEESERMKSAFLANMSHEIRTPMNGILGFTELLQLKDYTKEERLQFINIIRQSGNRMLNTINNIIDVSKLESGVEQMVIKEINIDHLLEELFQFFEPEAASKKLQLKLEKTKENTDITFYSDEYKLNSILTNLLKNAIKFTQEGFVKLEYTLTKSEAHFNISDSGIGIEKQKQELIFGEFIQADHSNSSGYEGSGLGLSIAKGYATLLEGEIKLESKPKQGSTFFVRIPNLERQAILNQELNSFK